MCARAIKSTGTNQMHSLKLQSVYILFIAGMHICMGLYVGVSKQCYVYTETLPFQVYKMTIYDIECKHSACMDTAMYMHHYTVLCTKLIQ